MSTNPLESIEDPNNNTEIDLPNIYPLHYTISLNESKVYQIEDTYRKFNCSQYVHPFVML